MEKDSEVKKGDELERHSVGNSNPVILKEVTAVMASVNKRWVGLPAYANEHFIFFIYDKSISELHVLNSTTSDVKDLIGTVGNILS